MSAKGTFGEPWQVMDSDFLRDQIFNVNRFKVASFIQCPEHRDRIIACVNACDGINPTALRDVIAAAVDALEPRPAGISGYSISRPNARDLHRCLVELGVWPREIELEI